jgi:hypothetical protein
MRHRNATSRILGAFLGIACLGLAVHAQEPGCRTGAAALADAYILANPLYAYFFGELEPYVAANSEHFRANGDAVRCAAALSRSFLASAIQLYDPNDRRRQDELNARLGEMGISPGPQESTPASQLYGAAMQLSRLARVLPAAAEGNYEPFRTPISELEQMQIVAGQLLRTLLQDPGIAGIMAQVEPVVRELASLEHQALRQAAAKLAAGH